MPGVYDALTAKIAEQVGFDVLFTGGFSIAATDIGFPDLGLLTMTENLNRVRKIIRSIQTPLVADVDTGYGNPLNVIRTVSECVEMGLAGIILEDQEWPKKCGHFEGKRVISMEEHARKIKAARLAAGEHDLIIIGRTDAREPLGLQEAIKRGKAYHEAGADVVFVEAPRSVEELREICQSIDAPCFANMIEGGKTPLLSASDLRDIGFKMVVYPLTALFATTTAVRDALTRLKTEGTTIGFPTISLQEFENLIGVQKFKELEQKFIG